MWSINAISGKLSSTIRIRLSPICRFSIFSLRNLYTAMACQPQPYPAITGIGRPVPCLCTGEVQSWRAGCGWADLLGYRNVGVGRMLRTKDLLRRFCQIARAIQGHEVAAPSLRRVERAIRRRHQPLRTGTHGGGGRHAETA